MKLANFVSFQLVWFAAVLGAAHGQPSAGVAALALHVAWHLWSIEGARDRAREGLYLTAAGIAGFLLDTALAHAVGLRYAMGAELQSLACAPAWIVALWVAFATLPRYSLAWLRARPAWWSAVFGAFGGPLSFHAGVRLGAVGVGGPTPWSGSLPAVPSAPASEALFASGAEVAPWIALGLEYALLTPLLLRLAPASDHSAAAPSSPSRSASVGGSGPR